MDRGIGGSSARISRLRSAPPARAGTRWCGPHIGDQLGWSGGARGRSGHDEGDAAVRRAAGAPATQAKPGLPSEVEACTHKASAPRLCGLGASGEAPELRFAALGVDRGEREVAVGGRRSLEEAQDAGQRLPHDLGRGVDRSSFTLRKLRRRVRFRNPRKPAEVRWVPRLFSTMEERGTSDGGRRT